MNWEELHEFSNEELLILVPDAEKTETHNKIIDFSEPAPPPEAKFYYTASTRMPEIPRSRQVQTLIRQFGLSLSDMPCIFFFPDPEGKEGYVLRINPDCLRETRAWILEIFDCCRRVVEERNGPWRGEDEKELIDLRRECMNALSPMFRGRRFVKSFRKAVLSTRIADIAGIISVI